MQAFKIMFKERFKVMNLLLLLELGITLITFIIQLFTSGSLDINKIWIGLGGSFALWLGIFFFVYPIALAILTIRQFFFNRFRMIPISEMKLYLSSIFATFLNMIYVFIVQIIIGTASALIIIKGSIQAQSLLDFVKTRIDFSFADYENIAVSFVLILFAFIVMTLLVNCGVFLGQIVADVLPFGRSRWVKVVIYIITIIILIYISNFVDINNLDNIWLAMLVPIVEAAVLIGINQYLLRFIETSK
ncbi:hypothetical protein Q2T76_04640 [Lactobacillus sp. YT155]|uniref:hypothetical protein n=1 Tax=Lactobacillus sp. YT155 TaxID=3060955 RepID=UPI00265F3CD2|nr:hypothetical protein [Lactobacillus sp. YT155]MDO1605344.1 hypothetical protein [Lactobacillus sp. YT155]